MLVLKYEKKNYHKIFYSSSKRIATGSEIDETFKSMHQSIMTKIKNFNSENGVAETIVKHSIMIFEL